MTRRTREMMLDYYRRGLSQVAVARKHGVSATTVREALRGVKFWRYFPWVRSEGNPIAPGGPGPQVDGGQNGQQPGETSGQPAAKRGVAA